MAIIDRKIINPNIYVKSYYGQFKKLEESALTYSEIIYKIDQAKTYLITERKAKVGQKVFLVDNSWPNHLIWFFACAELGLSFIVSDYPSLPDSKSVINKLNLYGQIDHVIVSSKGKLYRSLSSYLHGKIIESSIYDSIKNPSLNLPTITDGSVPLLYSTTSGTTGTPRIVQHSHEFFYNLLERNAKLYQLKEEDKCLHTKGLHHGSVTGVYFLPTIKYCSYHVYAPILPEIIKENWVYVLQKEKINKCLFFYDMIEIFNEQINYEIRHEDLQIFVLSPVTLKQANNLVGNYKYKITSIFGCTETSGPLFLPSITPENLSDDYDFSNFGSVLDDFYKINLSDDDLLLITMPDGNIICTGDKFTLKNNEYIFHGRDNFYRVNGTTIYYDVLISLIKEFTNLEPNSNFNVAIDNDYNQIYLRTDVPIDEVKLNEFILNNAGKDYQISKTIVAPKDSFMTGIKFDNNELRLVCRDK